MNLKEVANQYFNAVHDTDRERARSIVDGLTDSGIEPEEIVFKVIIPSIEEMINGFLKEQIILTQHYIATKISEELVDELITRFKKKPVAGIKVVIGCARGDFHGLGKKIVSGTLKANMISCIDLGLNVKPESFVEEAVKNEAGIIGVSSMMVHTAIGDFGPKGVRKVLRDNGLEDKIKLIVGGAPYKFDKDLYRRIEADAWADNGLEAVTKVKELIQMFNHAK